MHTITSIDHLRQIAKRRVPRMFYEYVDAGSWTESTYRDNEGDFGRLRFRQRVAVDISSCSTAGTMAGVSVTMPVAIAPTGLAGMLRGDGEILAARAAKTFGVPYTLSTVSICAIEDVAQAIDGHPFWFQLYVMRDRRFVKSLMKRARAVGCEVLVLTLDLPVSGQRNKDIRNGLSIPPRMTLANVLNMMSKPRWAWSMLGTRRRTFGNIVGHVDGLTNLKSVSEWAFAQHDQTQNWDDVAWIRKCWNGRLILKGIQDAEDAQAAVACGADGIIVSNHGGRQLDGAVSSIEALPAIVDQVGNSIEVFVDGGIRSGQDVLKAMALGARGAFIGRAALYGLGALGEQGVKKCLELIKKELELSMKFCGKRSLAELDRSMLLGRGFGELKPLGKGVVSDKSFNEENIQ